MANKRTPTTLSIVVPVFNSEGSLDRLCREINESCLKLSTEIILVDDGSRDQSWKQIRSCVSKYQNVHGIKLSKNYGQHNATLAGIREAKGQFIATIDDDLQFPAQSIPLMFEELQSNNFDLIYGLPIEVNNSSFRKLGSRTIKGILSKVFGIANSNSLSSFRLFKTAVTDSFDVYVGPNVSIDSLLHWGTNNIGTLPVPHSSREFGKSNYNFFKLFQHGLDIITAYSTLPLRIASGAGILTALFGLGLFIFTIVSASVSNSSVPGFATLSASIAIFSGVQLLFLGIIGEYLARMHFRIMNKPSYNIGEKC